MPEQVWRGALSLQKGICSLCGTVKGAPRKNIAQRPGRWPARAERHERKSSKKKAIRTPSPVDKVGLTGPLGAPGQLTNRRVGVFIPVRRQAVFRATPLFEQGCGGRAVRKSGAATRAQRGSCHRTPNFAHQNLLPIAHCLLPLIGSTLNARPTYNGRHAFTLSIARKRSAVPSFS